MWINYLCNLKRLIVWVVIIRKRKWVKARKQHNTTQHNTASPTSWLLWLQSHPIRILEIISLVRCFPRNPPIHFNFRLIQTRLILLRISTQTNGFVHEHLTLRRRRLSRRRHGIARRVSGEACLRSCVTRSHQILRYHSFSSKTHLWRYLVLCFWRCSSSCLVHQAFSWYQRFIFVFNFGYLGFHFYELFRSKGNRVLFVVDSKI